MHILPTLLALLISVAGFTDKELATALRGEIAVHTESSIAPRGNATGRDIGAADQAHGNTGGFQRRLQFSP